MKKPGGALGGAEELKKSSLSTKLACGAIAGVIGTSIIFPIDSVKTRLQNQKSTTGSTVATPQLQYNGIIDCFKKVVRNEGVGGLYRGLAPNLIGIIPEKAIKLAVNDYVREYFAERLNNPKSRNTTSSSSSYSPLVTADTLPIQYGVLAGASAGFCQVVATNPMEIVKIRMQLAAASSTSATTASSSFTTTSIRAASTSITPISIVKELGLRGLYRGTAATLCRDVPFSFLFFPTLAVLKQRFSEFDRKYFQKSGEGSTTAAASTSTPTTHPPAPFWAIFASGITSGIIAAGAVTPMDVVKTRLQVQPKPGDPVYNGMAHCYREIIAHEGPKALFKGVIPRILIVSPLFAITVLVYEFQQRYLSSKKSSPSSSSLASTTIETSTVATSLKK